MSKLTIIDSVLNEQIDIRKLLIIHHSSYRCANKHEEFLRKEALRYLAFAPIKFFKEVSEAIGSKISDIISIFKDSKIVRFFGKIGWSFSKLYDLLKLGYKSFKKLENIVKEYVEHTKVGKWTKEVLEDFQKFLDKHPMAKRIGGVAVAAILVLVWFNMAYTGDPQYDFDMTDVLGALGGSYSLAEIFGGYNGLKLLTTIALGTAIGLSFPWPGAKTAQFITSIIYSLKKKFA